MNVHTPSKQSDQLDRRRIKELTRREEETFASRTKRSREYLERASKVMPGGVPSSYQMLPPWPVYLERGEGSRVWDVDGNEYTDFHNGFGVVCFGHGNPKIVEAIQAQAPRGTHFAAPTEHSIAVAEELARRFSFPQWRFNNSGSEATLDAVHLARAATGRKLMLKIEGAYHGHHDHLMVSVYAELDEIGDRDHPNSVPFGKGFPREITELTEVVPFNDASALERTLDRLSGQVAGLIIEPIMMNIKIVMPEAGYLERVRELTEEHGVKLIFDEVKTGSTVGYGGAVKRFGIAPDMITLSKSTFGGLPGGAIGMSEEIAALVEDGEVNQFGTFNGNPLVMAASHATLTEVLTPETFEKLDALNEQLLSGSREILDRYGVPGYAVGMGAKGCVVFAAEPVKEYRDFLTLVDSELDRLDWLYHINRGFFMTAGDEWTVSVPHTAEDVARYLEASEELARDVTGS